MADSCPFDVTPLAQSRPVKTPPVFNLNYTCQDYWSLKDRVLKYCKDNYGEYFNDFFESSLAVMLIEAWAFIADTLHFKIDQIANEVFIDTVTEPENAFRLAKLVGYTPKPPVPARALFTATLHNVILQDVRITTPLRLSLPNPDGADKIIELFPADVNDNPLIDEDIIIPAGSMSVNNIIGIEGQTHNITFTSNGEPNQIMSLTTPVLWKSVQVYVDGQRWHEVESFTDSHPRQEFRVEYNWHYQGFVVFGNNRGGMVPPNGAKVSISYRTGGGAVGNVITGAIDRSVNVHVPGFSHMIVVRFKNYTKGEFGYNGETIEDIRRNLPAYLKTQQRAVTGLDYKTLAEQFMTPYNGIVGKATAVLRNHGCAGNIIDLYVLAREANGNLTRANDNLKNELMEELEKKKMFTDHVCIRDADILLTDIHIDVTLDRIHRKSEEQLRERIERRINLFFGIANWEFGQSLREGDIQKVLAEIREVDHYDITFTTARQLEKGQGGSTTVVARFNEIVRPDNIVISFTYQREGR